MNQSPRVLGNRYEVGDLLGRGGMAEVHLGRDTRLGRVVAIKLLRTDLARDPVFQARFRREAQSAAGLNHPSIVAVYDTGEEDHPESGGGAVSLPYIVMEYVEGRTLRDVLREGQPMEVQQALEVTGGVLSALDYSHRMGIVHRDIKPANVMLTRQGDVKVMDFGIARALADVSATMTQTQAVIGTAQYLSPEQARGETVDARSDLYSAGCLLFELMTGRPPFIADSPVAVAYQHVREAPPAPSAFNPRIPEAVDRIVLHALAKDREARYQTANDFRADLEAALAGRAVAASTMALAAPAIGGAQGATDYLPQSAGATQLYGAPGYPAPGQTQAYAQQAGGGYNGGYGAPPYDARYARRDQGPDGGYNGGYDAGYDAYDRYPPEPEQYSRRSERQAAARGSSGKTGFILFALAVLAVFAAAAYGASYVVNQNSAANAQVQIGPVDGLSRKDAVDKLLPQGWQVEEVPQANDTIPKDTVIGTEPKGVAQKGSRIKLFISTGPDQVTVPDVQGKTVEEAKQLLTAKGLKVNGNVNNPVPGNGIAKGLVVGTEPAVNTPVKKGATVTLNVSNGKVKVPDVTGKNYDDALKALGDAGITLVIKQEVASDQAPGTVLDQDPKANDNPAVVAQVTLTVAVAGQANQNGQNNNGGQTDQNGQPQNGQNGQNNGNNGNGQNNGNG